MFRRFRIFPMVIFLFFGLSGIAGELVLRNGKRIVTMGPWVIKDRFVEYKMKNGNLYRLPLKLVDQKRSSQEDPEPEVSDMDRVLAKVKEREQAAKKEENIHDVMALEEDFKERETTKITDENLETYVIRNHDFYGYRKEFLLYLTYVCVGQNDAETLAKILHVGVPLNESEENFSDPILIYAVRRSNPQIIGMLLKAGAHPDQLNRQNETPLLVNLSRNQSSALPIAKLLLEYKANPNMEDKSGRTPLQMALISRWPETVGLLLEEGARPNEKTSNGTRPLTLAIQRADLKSSLALLQKGAEVNYTEESGLSPLFIALNRSNLAILEPLVKKGANLNFAFKGHTPLMLAISKDQLDLSKKFLQWGADPNLSIEERAPYHLAIDNSNEAFLDILIKNRLKRSLYPEALAYAAQKGNLAAIKRLLKTGVSAKSNNQDGDPVLVLAARHGHLDVVRELIKAGADVYQKSAAGYSAYVEAKGPDEAAIKDLIRSHFKK